MEIIFKRCFYVKYQLGKERPNDLYQLWSKMAKGQTEKQPSWTMQGPAFH